MPVSPLSQAFFEYYDEYLRKSKLSDETIHYYMTEGKKFIKWCTDNGLSPTAIENISEYGHYMREKYSISVFTKKKSAIGTFEKFGIEIGIFNNHPEENSYKIKPYTDKEITYLKTIMLAAGKNVTRYRNLLAFELALHGLSLKEIVSIKPTHINLVENMINLEDRVVPFHAENDISEYYEKWHASRSEADRKQPYTYLITTLHDSTKPLRNSVLLKSFDLITDLGSLDLSIERLNSTHLDILIKSGISDREIVKQMGLHIKRLPEMITFVRSIT